MRLPKPFQTPAKALTCARLKSQKLLAGATAGALALRLDGAGWKVWLLFAAIPDEQSSEVKQKNREIAKASFHELLPQKASPSAKYF
jgi:hypothetical protein